jgi:peptide/nickel transport system substrate-binding protein
MKDESARYAALRTGRLDVLQSITWSAAEELKKNAPHLKWARWLQHGSAYIAMRTDTKPFTDVRVRRALNMAINKQEIVSSFYGGNAEVFAYPQHPDYGALFRAAVVDARIDQGALRLQPGQGQEAAGRGGIPERLHLQGAHLRLRSDDDGPRARWWRPICKGSA